MEHRDKVQAVLGEFARSVRLDRLALDDDDQALLIFDDTYEVQLEFAAGEGLLTLACLVGAPRAADETALLRMLLRANAFWRELPMTFALDPETDQVVQLRSLAAADLDLARFQAALAGYLEALASWSRVVAGEIGAAPERAAALPVSVDELDFRFASIRA